MSIPNEIKKMYSFLSWRDKLYIKLRWRLCPFELIEQQLPKKGMIVDAGCGYGLLTNLIALRSEERNVYGFDLNEKRINIAKKSVGNKYNILFELKDVNDLKLGSCDAVIMSDFLHHISYEEQNKLILQIKSKLKDDGILIIQDIVKKPLWKYLFASNLDRVLNCFPKLYYRDQNSWVAMLSSYFDLEIIKADKGLPLPDVLLICKKKL